MRSVLAQLAEQAEDPGHEERGQAGLRHVAGIVKVKRYGRGLVEEANTLQVNVAFSDGTRRCFQPEYLAHHKAGNRARKKSRRNGTAAASPAGSA